MSTPDSPLQGVKLENEPVDDAHGLPTNTASILNSPLQDMNVDYEYADGLPTNDMLTLDSPLQDVNIDPKPVDETHGLPADTMPLLNSPLQDVYMDYEPCDGLPTTLEEPMMMPQPSFQVPTRRPAVYQPPGMSPESFLRQMTTWNGMNNILNGAGMRANPQHISYQSPYAAGNVEFGYPAPMTSSGHTSLERQTSDPQFSMPTAQVDYGGNGGARVGRGANGPDPADVWNEAWANSPDIRSYLSPETSLRNEIIGIHLAPPRPSQLRKRAREAQEQDEDYEEDEPQPKRARADANSDHTPFRGICVACGNRYPLISPSPVSSSSSDPESDSSDEKIKVEVEVYDVSTAETETILHEPGAAAQEEE
ncbi:hypothetical protein F5Y01DRAFT_312825 [Xylaria sp. FL0043]|nr:hypothetical protein F5Y01DRAFT_312825 [Xylaria sp. FL0043]